MLYVFESWQRLKCLYRKVNNVICNILAQLLSTPHELWTRLKFCCFYNCFALEFTNILQGYFTGIDAIMLLPNEGDTPGIYG